MSLTKLVRAANGSDRNLKKALSEFAKREIKEQRIIKDEPAAIKEGSKHAAMLG